MPTYFLKTRQILTGLITVLTLASCTSLPEKPKKQTSETPTQTEQTAPNQTETTQPLSLADYKKLRSEATANSEWGKYIIYSEAIWQLVDTAQQSQIEEQVWAVIRSLSEVETQKLAQSKDTNVQAWHALFRSINQPGGIDPIDQLNLQEFDREASFNTHLLPRLLAEQPETASVKQIAVLLPMQGKYKIVSAQIRSGIMKAFFASDQTTTIKFYDSTDLTELETVYTQAKQDGADRIIGPLRKEAIRVLASFHDQSMLVLNSYEYGKLPQFNFKAANPAKQMQQRFTEMGLNNIGILTNDKPKNIAKAKYLQSLWEQQAGKRAEISIYPDEKPRLRDALGKLIHENTSKERYKNIRWSVGNVEFLPRTREDLDGIVIFDNTNRMAVFRPQFDFFGLTIPLFSDSAINPKNFQKQTPNRDLSGIQFLGYQATLQPNDLINKFEAFGWDSFLVTTHYEKMAKGACLSSAKTGILSLENNQVKQAQLWLTYLKNGTLAEAPRTSITQQQTQVPAVVNKPSQTEASAQPPSVPNDQAVNTENGQRI